MFETETETLVPDQITTEELDSQVAEILNPEEVVKDTQPEATAGEDLDATETPKDSVGLVNLRNHAEALEADINNVYKPATQVVEKFGGIEAVEDGMSLYSALQEYEADKAATSFLDKVYELSPERYNAVVQNIFQTHGDDFLKFRGIVGVPTSETPKESFDWKELDEQDPVRSLIEGLQSQLEAAQQKLNSTQGQREQEAIEAEKEARVNEFLKNRYEPLEKALSGLNFGEDTQAYRNDIRRAVEGAIEEDQRLMQIFQEAAEMVRDGNGKLAASRITEFDKASANYINQVIQRHISRYSSDSAALKSKIENSNLPRATEPSPAAPARAVPVMTESARAFDDDTMLARLRNLEASGRLPSR